MLLKYFVIIIFHLFKYNIISLKYLYLLLNKHFTYDSFASSTKPSIYFVEFRFYFLESTFFHNIFSYIICFCSLVIDLIVNFRTNYLSNALFSLRTFYGITFISFYMDSIFKDTSKWFWKSGRNSLHPAEKLFIIINISYITGGVNVVVVALCTYFL